MIVTGRLKQRSYETREGEKRNVMELEVEDVGPALRNATAKVSKIGRTGDSTGGTAAAPATSTPADDPWATPAASGWGNAGTPSEEPPF